jgi:hypothetical protein
MGHSMLMWVCGGAWALLVGGGVYSVARRAATPGDEPTSRGLLAAQRAIATAPGEVTLVMFVHPKCPCSEASLEELRLLLAGHERPLRASVIMFVPDGQAEDWSQTAAWRIASAIAGVTVRTDIDGSLARECGARTSGQVFVYETDGRLVFEGGITESRGHVGDNQGRDVLTELLSAHNPSHPPLTHTPVFGCAIYSNTDDRTGLTRVR